MKNNLLTENSFFNKNISPMVITETTMATYITPTRATLLKDIFCFLDIL